MSKDKKDETVQVTLSHPEVDTALMQTAIPILGHVESTLNTTKIPGIKMYWEGAGLSITVKNRHYFVPSPNIKLLIMK